ncbi:ligase-associated DNA damage response endonuclease PdeM [Roseivivax isoporae]|uniref:Metallophosphoesterase n=1 Tax=Roseivivax isoporae LMG 25204 TaxID=1449351 RepID=X7FBC4_9RHOB|nr:ligase-associated DNA damage response endonuclease PdeM [Roseivivax isoporae]ETX30207.1 metallophosphoesterase [Roseivivax isoporae LMG 25204]
MNAHAFSFSGATLHALPSGGLFWPDESLLVVSDLHLGKCARLAEWGGAALPPYDTTETLRRLEDDLAATGATSVLCLGDSFDSVGIGAALPEDDRARIAGLQSGRDWIWIEGNHDRGPCGPGGRHCDTLVRSGLTFRHIATRDGTGEVSGHYHPKAQLFARGRAISRPCFLVDAVRLILPAYGVYAGGLRTDSATLSRLMDAPAQAILTGTRPVAIPMPRL